MRDSEETESRFQFILLHNLSIVSTFDGALYLQGSIFFDLLFITHIDWMIYYVLCR